MSTVLQQIRRSLCDYAVGPYAKGFSTALQGALQVTGSYCKSGVSGFSLRGVYKAPIGTTSREASLEFFSAN